MFGDKILAIDIDAIITNDLRPIVDRDESFVGWCNPKFIWNKVAGGIYLLRTGAHTSVWEDFDPKASPAKATAAGCLGSDQGWMSYKLFPPPAHWTSRDGVVSIKWLDKQTQYFPSSVRVVSTAGRLKPWDKELQEQYPWIKKHWKL